MHPSGHGYSKAKAFFKGYKGRERSREGITNYVEIT